MPKDRAYLHELFIVLEEKHVHAPEGHMFPDQFFLVELGEAEQVQAVLDLDIACRFV